MSFARAACDRLKMRRAGAGLTVPAQRLAPYTSPHAPAMLTVTVNHHSGHIPADPR